MRGAAAACVQSCRMSVPSVLTDELPREEGLSDGELCALKTCLGFPRVGFPWGSGRGM